MHVVGRHTLRMKMTTSTAARRDFNASFRLHVARCRLQVAGSGAAAIIAVCWRSHYAKKAAAPGFMLNIIFLAPRIYSNNFK